MGRKRSTATPNCDDLKRSSSGNTRQPRRPVNSPHEPATADVHRGVGGRALADGQASRNNQRPASRRPVARVATDLAPYSAAGVIANPRASRAAAQ